jgi:hypothetical protein
MYFILLIKLKYFQSSLDFLKNCLKILISTLVMCVLLIFFLNIFEDKLIYSNNFKSIYLIMIVVVSAGAYLFIAKILGVFKIKILNKLINGKKLVFLEFNQQAVCT